MIRNEVFNLEGNLREAARYRLGLRNSIEQTDRRRDLESLLLSKKNVFKRLRFFSAETKEKLTAEITSSFFKNFSYFFYYCGENQETFFKKNKAFEKELNNFVKGLKEELIELSETVKEANVELNSKYTKVKVYRRFLEKSLLEEYDYIDRKTERNVKKSERLETLNGTLTLPKLFENIIYPKSISLIREETTSSDIDFGQSLNKKGNVSYTIVKLNNQTNGVLKKTKPVKLGLSLKFGLKRKINKVTINYNSELPISLIKNKIKYKTETGYSSIDCKIHKNDAEDIIIYFDEVETSEIQLGFNQSKYFDNLKISKSKNNKLKKLINKSSIDATFLNLEEESVRIYNFEIDFIKVEQIVYKNFGLHREKDFIVVNKPLTMQMKVSSLIDLDNCFIEKEAHIVLYGDSSREAFKNPKSIYEKTPKINTIISLGSGNLLEREGLFFKNKQAKCNLYPDLRDSGDESSIAERLQVYKNDELLILGTDYNISLDGGSQVISPEATFRVIERGYPERIAGEFCIELNSKPEKLESYHIDYKLDKNFFLDESKTISMIDGEVVFGEELESSVGFIRPRIILRNASKNNSSVIIKEIAVLVEELESNENNYIELETYEEREVRSTSNVV